MPSDLQDRLKTKWDELQRVSRELDELLIEDGTISRHARTHFCPGDLYCSVFHLFDLMPFKAVSEPQAADAAQ